MKILNGYKETKLKSLSIDYNNIKFITKNNKSVNKIFNENITNNLKSNISFWSQYWLPENEIIILHGDEHDLDWMKEQLTLFNMVDGLNMRTIDSLSNGGGGGVVGPELKTPLFWQIIGSDVTNKELKSVGMAKLTGHLYAHIAQPGFLNTVSNKHIKTTMLPCWYIEGQSDYHTLCLLDGDFIENRQMFLKTAYVPDGYREKIKSASIEDWYKILLKDGDFEGIPVTYEYWAGFFVYEELINEFGTDKVMGLVVDFSKTLDFRKSLSNVLNIDYKDFYLNMSKMLYDNAKHVMI